MKWVFIVSTIVSFAIVSFVQSKKSSQVPISTPTKVARENFEPLSVQGGRLKVVLAPSPSPLPQKQKAHPLLKLKHPEKLQNLNDPQVTEAFDIYLSQFGLNENSYALSDSPLDTLHNLSLAMAALDESPSRFKDEQTMRGRLIALTLVAQSGLSEAKEAREKVFLKLKNRILNGEKGPETTALKSDFRFLMMLMPQSQLKEIVQIFKNERNEEIRKTILSGAHSSFQRRGLSDSSVREQMVQIGFDLGDER